jgi:predicted ribosome quality control (RQC) complex YloA/Tae2 family protein
VWQGRTIARRFVSPDGMTVLVGKSAQDNDVLSLQLAQPDDFWLHVAADSGSHVVVRNPERLERPPRETLRFAAALAAGYSKLSEGGRTSVHWTQARHVSKRKGQPPGQVMLGDYQSIDAKPSKGPAPAPAPPPASKEESS